MTRTTSPPDWTLADVREHAAAWRRGHGALRAGTTAGVALVVVAVAWPVAGFGEGTLSTPATVTVLLVGATLGVALGAAAGHAAAAGRRYPRHVVALPELLQAVVRPVRPTDVVLAAAAAVTVGALAPPIAAIAVGGTLMLAVPTGPGVALASAIDRAADAIAGEAGVGPHGERAVLSTLLLTGLATTAIAVLRVLWASDVTCGLDHVGVPCGGQSPLLLAIGAAPAAWSAVPLGAAIADSLERALHGTPAPAAPAPAGPAVAPDTAVPTEPVRPDELRDLVRDRFEGLSARTRTQVVHLVATALDADVRIEDGDDVMDSLDDAVRRAGPEATVAAVGRLHGHVGTIGRLRTQYQRTPRLARGAVERTAATAVRTAGAPGEVAGPAVKTLLSMPEDDWAIVEGTLDEIVDRFATST